MKKSVWVALMALGVSAAAGLGAGVEEAAAPAAAPAVAPTAEEALKEAAKDMVKMAGTVGVTKDAAGVVQGVTITTADGKVYHVKINPQGRALEQRDGAKVEAMGIVTEEDGQQWVKIKACRAAPAEGEAAPAE